MCLYFRLIIPLLWAPLWREFMSTGSPACCQRTLCVILIGHWAHSPRRLRHISMCPRFNLYRHHVYGWMRMAIGEVLYSLELSRALVAQGTRPSKHIHLVKQIPVELWPVLVLIQSLVDRQSFKDRQICVTAYFIDPKRVYRCFDDLVSHSAEWLLLTYSQRTAVPAFSSVTYR